MIEGPPRAGFTSLDALPCPDFDEYFRVLRATDPEGSIAPWMPVEASRGCWWGAVSHCTFCGLNGDTMAFRTKDWRKVVAETDALALRHGPAPLHFADNILGMAAFRDLIPFWATRRDRTPKFFEIKANLKRSQVLALGNAGVTTVQPGIESLCDATLARMRKGVTAAQNVAVLRWAAEAGIHAYWNLLFGFPGEDAAAFGANMELLRRIVHLRPPDAVAAIRMDRFSPNFERAAELGFTGVEPIAAYRHLLPMTEGQIRRAAYFFTYEHPLRESAIRWGEPLVAFAEDWRAREKEKANGRLALMPHLGGGRVLVDDRWNRAPRAVRPSMAEEALLLACDAPATRARALATAARHVPDADAAALEPVLDRLIAEDVIGAAGESLVTLALLPHDLTVNGLARAS